MRARHSYPGITVGIPAYNARHTIARCIGSVLAQDYPDVTVLISDNNSSDTTRSIIGGFCASDSRIRLTRQDRNRGPTRNFRAVSEASTTPFFMWLAADDWLSEPDYLSRCISPLMVDPDIVMVCPRVHFYWGSRLWDVATQAEFMHDSAEARVSAYYRSVFDNSTFYGLVRADAARRVKLRRWFGADWWFVASLAATGKIAVQRDAILNRRYEPRREYAADFAEWEELPRIAARFARESLAVGAAMDCLGLSQPFRRIPMLGRTRLAREAAGEILRRRSRRRP